MKYIGKNIERTDVVSKVTGKATFLDDLFLPGLLYAQVLHPTMAHAKIRAIDTIAAEKAEGVVRVVTGQGCSLSYGDNIRDLTPMAEDKVRHIGDAVAAVIADSAKHAADSLKLIKVEYEPLPIYIDAREAMQKDAQLIHENNGQYWHLDHIHPVPGTNIAMHYEVIKGDAEAALQEADIIVEGEFNYPLGSCAAIEPHGSIAWFKEDGSIEIWSSSICPTIIQEETARLYGLPVSEVRVHIPDIGGCFGYKSDVVIEELVVYIASFVKGYPVKYVTSRKEDFTSTLLGHGIRTKMRIGATKNGQLLALKAELLHTTGAYADTGCNVLMAAAHNAGGSYEFPNFYANAYSVYTNTPPVGAFRGYGHAESHLALECLMDRLARKLGMSPFELRARNYLGPGKMNTLGEMMNETNGDVQSCANIIEQELFATPKPTEDIDYYYGRGCAAVMKSPKGAPFSSKGCYMKFNIDGSVSVNMGGGDVGQGLRTVVRQVAAEALSINPSKVHVYTEIDTQFSPWEWQTIGSMFTIQGGRAIIRTANKLIAILKRTACQVLRVDEDMLEYDGESVFYKHDPTVRVAVRDICRGYIYPDGVTIGEIAQASSDARLPLYSNPREDGRGRLGVTYTFGVQAAQIRVSKKTGEILVDEFASCFDVGKVINPRNIRGQVAGGVLIGIGASLYEEVKFDNLGRILNPHFGQYKIPRLKDAPGKQFIAFVETPEQIGPYGARGIGEHPVVGVAPAILNAILDTIGVEFNDIPVTAKQILQVLEEKGRAQHGD